MNAVCQRMITTTYLSDILVGLCGTFLVLSHSATLLCANYSAYERPEGIFFAL